MLLKMPETFVIIIIISIIIIIIIIIIMIFENGYLRLKYLR